jgi:hypothetical protein
LSKRRRSPSAFGGEERIREVSQAGKMIERSMYNLPILCEGQALLTGRHHSGPDRNPAWHMKFKDGFPEDETALRSMTISNFQRGVADRPDSDDGRVALGEVSRTQRS